MIVYMRKTYIHEAMSLTTNCQKSKFEVNVLTCINKG